MIDKHVFRQRLRALGLDLNKFAAVVHLQPDTLYRWTHGVPVWAYVLLVSWERLHAIHGRAWLDDLIARLGDDSG